MKKFLLSLYLLYAFGFSDLLAATPDYIQTRDGVIIFTDPVFSNLLKAVKLEVVPGSVISNCGLRKRNSSLSNFSYCLQTVHPK